MNSRSNRISTTQNYFENPEPQFTELVPPTLHFASQSPLVHFFCNKAQNIFYTAYVCICGFLNIGIAPKCLMDD